MEYTDKINGEITLAGHKTVHRKEASIMVRTRYTEEMKYVLFEKSDSLANPYTSGLFPITKLQRDN